MACRPSDGQVVPWGLLVLHHCEASRLKAFPRALLNKNDLPASLGDV